MTTTTTTNTMTIEMVEGVEYSITCYTDVWGNEDGWEVNDCTQWGTNIFISDNDEDQDIIGKLIAMDILAEDHEFYVSSSGCGFIEVYNAKNDCPALSLNEVYDENDD